MGENIVAGGVERVLRRFLFSREHQVEITLRFLANSSGTKKKKRPESLAIILARIARGHLAGLGR